MLKPLNARWSSTAVTVKKKKTARNHSEAVSYIMLSPQIIGFLIFSLYPIIWVYRYSMFDYDGFDAVFTGFKNYVRIFTNDPAYWKSLLNTFILAYPKLIIELPLALLIAVLLNERIIGKNFFRVAFYMPNVISVSIVALVFTFIFSSFNGLVNNILVQFGVFSQPHNWFSDKWSSMFVIITASIWQGFGANTLFFLAGLQNIPGELYEAAEIDGASWVKRFMHITVPMMLPILQIILMLAMINGMKIMDLVKVLTNGAPAGETNVVMLYIYQYFFETSGGIVKQYGYASALGVVTSVILALVTLAYLKMSKRASSIY